MKHIPARPLIVTDIDTRASLDAAVQPTAGTNDAWYQDLMDLPGTAWETAKDHPTAAILGGLAVGVAAFGAIRTALPRLAIKSLLPAVEEGYLVHLTSKEGLQGIHASGKLGGRWGIFGLPFDRVPQSELGRLAKTLVPRDTSHGVLINGEAAAAFQKPLPVGPFSLARRLAGVRSTPLGSIEMGSGRFIEGEIFKDGVFTQATRADRVRYGMHQWLLDYGIDTQVYTLGSLLAATRDFNQRKQKGTRSGA